MKALTLALLLGLVHGTATAERPAQGSQVTRLDHVRIVALAPGHGGDNKGCLGAGGIYEKIVTLQIALRVERLLTERTHATVRLTRRTDQALELRERTRMANAWNADVFISIHLNADEYARGFGVETWFLSPEAIAVETERVARAELAKSGRQPGLKHFEKTRVQALIREVVLRKAHTDSQALAAAVAKTIVGRTKAKLRGVHQAAYGVLKEASMPAIVVEAGFLTHRLEGPKLLNEEYQEAIAQGIVDGIVAFDRKIGGPSAPVTARTAAKAE